LPDSGSITRCIALLKAGESAAAQKLWESYFQRLVLLARRKLQSVPRRAADEEDVALSAFDSFCRAAEGGRFPQLADRNDLWQLLVVITIRKAVDLVAREHRQKRGGGRVHGESILIGLEDSTSGSPALEQILGAEPTPELAAQMSEECQRLLDLVQDEDLRRVALWKMEGYTNEEIAARLGCVTRSVERKLGVVRRLWTKELGS
jgi:DNA-directed RNA polymerase specialized sigma24 family protein